MWYGHSGGATAKEGDQGEAGRVESGEKVRERINKKTVYKNARTKQYFMH